jgi:hypothetical protein
LPFREDARWDLTWKKSGTALLSFHYSADGERFGTDSSRQISEAPFGSCASRLPFEPKQRKAVSGSRSIAVVL